MTGRRAPVLALLALVVCAALAGIATRAVAGEPVLVFETPATSPVIELRGLPPAALQNFQEAAGPVQQQVLALHVGACGQGAAQPVLGRYEPRADVIAFVPRFALRAGLSYCAEADLSPLGGQGKLKASQTLPPPPPTAPTRVSAIYPSADRLPENTLRFYLYFSAPMQGGEVLRFIHLIDLGAGADPTPAREVEGAFVTLPQELWDPQMRRLTLLLDPGRIKRGVGPNRDVGPPLVAGRSYRLQVDAGLRDATSRPLAEDAGKVFTAGAAVRLAIAPARWLAKLPRPGSSTPLELVFGRSVDQALAARGLRLVTATGERVAGEASLMPDEAGWRFSPAGPWPAGQYQLRIDAGLEDVSGNNLRAPFDVDVCDPADRTPEVPAAFAAEAGPVNGAAGNPDRMTLVPAIIGLGDSPLPPGRCPKDPPAG